MGLKTEGLREEIYDYSTSINADEAKIYDLDGPAEIARIERALAALKPLLDEGARLVWRTFSNTGKAFSPAVPYPFAAVQSLDRIVFRLASYDMTGPDATLEPRLVLWGSAPCPPPMDFDEAVRRSGFFPEATAAAEAAYVEAQARAERVEVTLRFLRESTLRAATVVGFFRTGDVEAPTTESAFDDGTTVRRSGSIIFTRESPTAPLFRSENGIR